MMKNFKHYLLIFSALFIGFTLNISAQELSESEKQLWEATQKGDKKQIKKLLKKGVNPHCLNQEAKSPIFWLLRNQKFELAEFFIKHRTDINEPNYINFKAVQTQQISNLELIKINLLSMICQVPYDDTLSVQFLLKHKTEIEPKNQGMSPLHLAILNRNLNIAKLLIENGASINRKIYAEVPMYHNFTSLGLIMRKSIDYMALDYDSTFFSFLLDKGANPRKDISVERRGKIQSIPYELLFLMTPDIVSENLIHKMCESGADFSQIIDMEGFFKGEAFVITIDKSMEISDNEIMTLLDCGAGINSQVLYSNKSKEIGFTALHFAVKQNRESLIYKLIKAKADTTVKAKNGKTAMDLAREKGTYGEIMQNFQSRNITNKSIPKFSADSLLQVLNQSPESPQKIEILNQLGKNYTQFFQIDEAEKHLKKAIELSQKLNDKNGEASAFKLLGDLYKIQVTDEIYTTSEVGDLYEIYQKYYQLKSKPYKYKIDEVLEINLIKPISSFQEIYVDKGVKLRMKRLKVDSSFYQKAQKYHKMAFQIRTTQKGDAKVWGLKEAIKNLKTENKYEEAEKLHLEWVKIRENEGNEQKLFWAMKAISEFYSEQEAYDKMDIYNEKIIKVRYKNKPNEAINFLLNMGHSIKYSSWENAENESKKEREFREKRMKLRFKYYTDAFKLNQSLARRQVLYAFAKEFYECTYEKENDYLVVQYAEMHREYDDKLMLINGLINGARFSANDELSLKYAQEAHEMLLEMPTNPELFYSWVKLVRVYRSMGDNIKTLKVLFFIHDQNFRPKYTSANWALREAKNMIQSYIDFGKGEGFRFQYVKILDEFIETHPEKTDQKWAHWLQSKLCQRLKNYSKSAEHQVKFISVTSPNFDIYDYADAGFLFQLAKDKANAVKYFNEGIGAIKETSPNDAKIPEFMFKIAYCYVSFKDIKNEEETYLKASEIARKNLGDTKGVNPNMFAKNLLVAHECLMKLSRFYSKQKDKKEALKYAENALRFAKAFPENQISDYEKNQRINSSDNLIQSLK